jgi:trans-aconitate methyltransferase
MAATRKPPDPLPRLYTEFAEWWPLLSRPADYAEEAVVWYGMMVAASDQPPTILLELGSGGGNNASHMKAWAKLTLTDRSPQMLDVSRKLNPQCEHLQGDMREIRLNHLFDAVFVHDAVSYLTSPEDLGRAMRTALVHCRPVGAALFVPDHVRETFRASTKQGGHDDDGRGLRYLAWSHEPKCNASETADDFVYMLRARDGTIQVVHDRHVTGLFPRATWLELMAKTGFDSVQSIPTPYASEAFLGTRLSMG